MRLLELSVALHAHVTHAVACCLLQSRLQTDILETDISSVLRRAINRDRLGFRLLCCAAKMMALS